MSTDLSNSPSTPNEADQLLAEVYEHLRRTAAAQMSRLNPGQTLEATALVHEAWMQLESRSHATWECRAHYYGAAARSMREVLIKNARRKRRLKHGDAWKRVELDESSALEAGALEADDLLTLNDALLELEEIDELQGQIVELRFFAGLTHESIAEMLGLTLRQVEGRWRFARAWLQRRVADLREDEA